MSQPPGTFALVNGGATVRLRYRKTRKIGPVRVTHSRSGWGVSIGGRLARLTRRSDGRLQTTVGIPLPGWRLEHVHGSRDRRYVARGRRSGLRRWMTGLVTTWVLLAGWLLGLGVPARFALALALGLAAIGGWAVMWARIAARRRQERFRPRPLPWTTARQAERVAWQWMRYLGYPDARLTGPGADGGIDVVAAGGVAQVKATAQPVGRPVIQQTAGAAAGRATAVFSLAGFTDQARRWATEHDVALFRLDRDGRVLASNNVADGWMAAADRRAREQGRE